MHTAATPPKPGDLELGELRQLGSDVFDAIADYHAGLAHRRVLPDVTPAEVAALFAGELAEEGEPAAALLEDWRQRVAPLSTAVGSPRHFGYVNGSGTTIGVIAEALAACTNTNAGAWKLGPAAAAIEMQCVRWLARFVGYRERAGGLFVSGGTMANFTALLTALRDRANWDTTQTGLQDDARSGRFRVYMSDHEGHISVVRAADLTNLGRDAVRRVPSRRDLTLDPAALDRAVREDRERGDLPFCVVAQLGSVNVGAVDPIDEIADVCAAHALWLHGDGACGLLAAGAAETRHLFRGLSRADSLSFDPHKFLGVPYDCGLVLVGEPDRLRRAFSITAPYLRGTNDEDERDGVDFLEYGPEMSRSFRALKVWMTLRFLGASGMRDVTSRGLALARRLHELVKDHPDFETLHEPVIPILSFRYVPHALADVAYEEPIAERIDRLNQDIAEAVQRSGTAFLMTTRIRGRVALRMSIASNRTTAADIDATFDTLAAFGRQLASHPNGNRERPTSGDPASEEKGRFES